MSEHIVGVQQKEYKGVKYKSNLEADTAEFLDKLGIPWKYEAKTYTLLNSFYSKYQKRKVMPIEYTPDFFIGPIMIEMKGYETPDWKIKKKFFFKLLSEQEPDAIWYMAKSLTQLILYLDNHWCSIGKIIQVTSKETKKEPAVTYTFSSFKEALKQLKLENKPFGRILRSLTGEVQYVYNYDWKLININI